MQPTVITLRHAATTSFASSSQPERTIPRTRSGSVGASSSTLFKPSTKSHILTDHYTLAPGKIGSGTYSTVRKATCMETGIEFTVKMVHKRNVIDGVDIVNEIDLTRSLDHPNIVKLQDTFEDCRNHHLVLELCTGGELFDRIVEVGSMSEYEASSIMRQIFGSVGYIHEHHVCHRDLKPENFIYASKGPLASTPVKLTDFGLSCRFKEGVPMKDSVGTPFYVAPEVLSESYGFECDNWSLGVIMFCLLSGQLPFDGPTALKVLKRVKKAEYNFEDEVWEPVSESATDLINALLEKSVQSRFTCVQALEHAWIREPSPASSAGCGDLGPGVIENLRALCAENKKARDLQKVHQSQ